MVPAGAKPILSPVSRVTRAVFPCRVILRKIRFTVTIAFALRGHGTRGRASFVYKDNGRRIVMALKHGDRLDLAKPAGRWLATAAVKPETDHYPHHLLASKVEENNE